MARATGCHRPSNWRGSGNCWRSGGRPRPAPPFVPRLWVVAQEVWRRPNRSAMAKLLLAEDNELTRHMLVRRLERSGHQVLAAADGLEAVRMACMLPPDLILMDLDMPVMD